MACTFKFIRTLKNTSASFRTENSEHMDEYVSYLNSEDGSLVLSHQNTFEIWFDALVGGSDPITDVFCAQLHTLPAPPWATCTKLYFKLVSCWWGLQRVTSQLLAGMLSSLVSGAVFDLHCCTFKHTHTHSLSVSGFWPWWHAGAQPVSADVPAINKHTLAFLQCLLASHTR